MMDNLSITVHAFVMHMFTWFSVDEILLPRYINWSTYFRGICTTTYLPSHKPPKSDEQDMLGTVGSVRTNIWATMFFTDTPTHERASVADQQGITYISSVRKLDAVEMTLECWIIGMDSERDSCKSWLLEWFNDDNDMYIWGATEITSSF